LSGTAACRVLLFLLATFWALTSSAVAQETWEERRARRCAYYRELVDVALEKIGRDKLDPDFLAGHEAFIAGGCFAGKAVCPVTPPEFAFADLLTMMTVSANMGSTFTPFRCPQRNG
jgi:hypothetical protein